MDTDRNGIEVHSEQDNACPDCGGATFRFVSDGQMTNMVCTACFACWHPELGQVSRVSPETCPGCALAPECRAATEPVTSVIGSLRRQTCTASLK